MNSSRRARLRIVALVVVLAGLLLAFALSGSLSSDKVRDWFDGYGAAGPIVFIACSSLLTVAMFPGPLLAGAAGLLFGTALGAPVAIVSATCGACLAFLVGRRWAHDAVEHLAGPRVQALRTWIGARGFHAVLLARLAPGMPYNVINYAAGLSPVSLGAFAAATVLGASPRAIAYAALGGHLGDWDSPAAIAAIALLGTMAVIGLITFRLSGPGRAMSSPDGRSEAPR